MIKPITSASKTPRDLPPRLRTFRLAWNPTDVKKNTMHTSRSVSLNFTSTVPLTYKIQVTTAKIKPPITGEGIQNLSKACILRFKNVPNIKATTARAIV